jgi:hypothetical protein
LFASVLSVLSAAMSPVFSLSLSLSISLSYINKFMASCLFTSIVSHKLRLHPALVFLQTSDLSNRIPRPLKPFNLGALGAGVAAQLTSNYQCIMKDG